MAGRALRAVDRVRAMDPDAVEGDEQAAAEALERGRGALLADSVEAQREQVGEALGDRAVEQIADADAAGNGLCPEERAAIAAGGFLLQATPAFKARGGLEEENRKGAGSGVGEVAALVAATAGMRQGDSGLPKGDRQAVQDILHPSCFDQRGSLCQW